MKRQTPTTPTDLERLADISGEPIEFDYAEGRAYIELDRETVWAAIPGGGGMSAASCSGLFGCGASWSGLRIEHCFECHQTFTGSGSGNKHRVGDHAVDVGPTRRRCLGTDEMLKKGMAQNARGQWTLGGTSPWASDAA